MLSRDWESGKVLWGRVTEVQHWRGQGRLRVSGGDIKAQGSEGAKSTRRRPVGVMRRQKESRGSGCREEEKAEGADVDREWRWSLGARG